MKDWPLIDWPREAQADDRRVIRSSWRPLRWPPACRRRLPAAQSATVRATCIRFTPFRLREQPLVHGRAPPFSELSAHLLLLLSLLSMSRRPVKNEEKPEFFLLSARDPGHAHAPNAQQRSRLAPVERSAGDDGTATNKSCEECSSVSALMWQRAAPLTVEAKQTTNRSKRPTFVADSGIATNCNCTAAAAASNGNNNSCGEAAHTIEATLVLRRHPSSNSNSNSYGAAAAALFS